MEDVLDVYHRPPDPRRPLVCLDELSKQLTGEVRTPLPPLPGHPARYDAEYERNGVANLCLPCAPLLGWRHVTVTDRRTRVDWAELIRDLVDVHFPAAERIVLVLDNLNTHAPASLYEAFPPEEAKRLGDKLELHHTPKHGSWLNTAEIELSALGRQCGVPPGPPADPRPGRAGGRSGGLDLGAQRGGGDRGLAVHHRRRPDQAQAPLPHPLTGQMTMGGLLVLLGGSPCAVRRRAACLRRST